MSYNVMENTKQYKVGIYIRLSKEFKTRRRIC